MSSGSEGVERATRGARAAGPREWRTLAGLCLLTASASAYEIVPAGVSPVLMERLALSPTGVGWLVSVMFATVVVTSVPVGVVLDRTDVRVVTGVAVLGLVAAGAWGWHATAAGDYASLFASRVFGAASFATVWNAGAQVVSRAFDAERRGTALGIFTASGTAGFALGQFGGPVVAETLGLAVVFVAFTPVAVVGFAVFWPASAGIGSAGEAGDDVGRRGFAAALTDRATWYVYAMGFAAYSLYLLLNSWMPTYLSDELGLSLTQSGAVVGLFAATGLVSRTGGGVLSDRLFDARRRPVAILSFGLSTPLVAVMAAVDSVVSVFVALLLAGFAIQLSIGLLFTYVSELVDPGVAGTAIATLTAVGLFGAFTAPLVAGALLEATGGFAAAFGYAVAAGALGCLLAWRAPEPGA